MRVQLLSSVTLFLTACQANTKSTDVKFHPVAPLTKWNWTCDELNSIRPVCFLDFLRQNPSFAVSVPGWDERVCISHWIQEEDIPILVVLLDSTEPCSYITSPLDSGRILGSSTIGNEALFLLNGFRMRKYPPTECSIIHTTDEVSVNAVDPGAFSEDDDLCFGLIDTYGVRLDELDYIGGQPGRLYGKEAMIAWLSFYRYLDY